MTSSTQDVIDRFADGKMPSGADFETLINAMVSRQDFDKSQVDFNAWKKLGTLQIGPADTGWKVERSDSGEFVLTPNDPNAARKNQSVDLYGWTRAFGRIGAFDDASALSGKGALIDRGRLLDAPANGEWTTIVQMPTGLAAFEIVAATEQFEMRKSNSFINFARLALGLEPPGPQIVHAIATATAPGREPKLDLMTPSRTTRLWRTASTVLVLALSVWAFVSVAGPSLSKFTALVETSTGAAVEKWLRAALSGDWAQYIVTGFLALLALRFAIQAGAAFFGSLRLRWVKTSDSPTPKWELKIHAPKDINRPNALIHYHITVLWG